MSKITTATRNVIAGANSICGHSTAASSSPAAPARYHGERWPTEGASHGGQRREGIPYEASRRSDCLHGSRLPRRRGHGRDDLLAQERANLRDEETLLLRLWRLDVRHHDRWPSI